MTNTLYRRLTPYLESFEKYIDLRDKRRSINLYSRTTVNRLLSLFEYNGLPDSIPQRELELMLICGGSCIIAEHQGDLYALQGGFGGVPDAYHRPTRYIIANPYLKLNKEFTIDEDCILVRNDYLMTGLMPMIIHWTTLIAENDLSIYLTTISQRIQNVIIAGDDIQKQSADTFFKDIEGGKFGAIVSSEFFEGIKSAPLTSPSGNAINQLIDLEQYLRAALFSEIGLNANFNMKKQSLHASEVGLNEEGLLPLIDEMTKMREEAIEKVNEKFGTNISVKLSSAWEQQREEIELDNELIESQIKAVEQGVTEPNNAEENGRKGGEENAKSDND